MNTNEERPRCKVDHTNDLHQIAEKYKVGDAIIVYHENEHKGELLFCGSQMAALNGIADIVEQLEINPAHLLMYLAMRAREEKPKATNMREKKEETITKGLKDQKAEA